MHLSRDASPRANSSRKPLPTTVAPVPARAPSRHPGAPAPTSFVHAATLSTGKEPASHRTALHVRGKKTSTRRDTANRCAGEGTAGPRSEERRVGKEGGSTWRLRGTP